MEEKKTILIILLVLGVICLIPDCVVRLKRIRNFQSVLFFVMIVVLVTCHYQPKRPTMKKEESK